MNKISEIKLYPKICEWFEQYLCSKYKYAEIIVRDTHSSYLSRFLQQNGYHLKFPMFDTYEIKTDITAVIIKNEIVDLGFVEIKTNRITLKDIGQLLGYCRVAEPTESFIISPQRISKPLHNLIEVYGKKNILKYNQKHIKIAQWDTDSHSIIPNSIIPRGK